MFIFDELSTKKPWRRGAQCTQLKQPSPVHDFENSTAMENDIQRAYTTMLTILEKN